MDRPLARGAVADAAPAGASGWPARGCRASPSRTSWTPRFRRSVMPPCSSSWCCDQRGGRAGHPGGRAPLLDAHLADEGPLRQGRVGDRIDSEGSWSTAARVGRSGARAWPAWARPSTSGMPPSTFSKPGSSMAGWSCSSRRSSTGRCSGGGRRHGRDRPRSWPEIPPMSTTIEPRSTPSPSASSLAPGAGSRHPR